MVSGWCLDALAVEDQNFLRHYLGRSELALLEHFTCLVVVVQGFLLLVLSIALITGARVCVILIATGAQPNLIHLT